MSLLVLVILGGLVYAGYKAYKANHEETSESRTIKSLPPTVQHTVAQMDPASQNAFFNEYDRKKKKVSVAYIVWILLGWHYLYLKKVGLQFAFWFTLGGFGFWWIADLFRMPSLVRGTNEMIAREALQTLAIGNQFRNSAPIQFQPAVIVDPPVSV
jgi:hypothetical protein